MVNTYQLLWYKKAYNTYSDIYNWYLTNRGLKAADKFRNSVSETVRLICDNPYMAPLDDKLRNRKLEYRSFPIHPYYRIIYYFKGQVICIVSIRDNRMENQN